MKSTSPQCNQPETKSWVEMQNASGMKNGKLVVNLLKLFLRGLVMSFLGIPLILLLSLSYIFCSHPWQAAK